MKIVKTWRYITTFSFLSCKFYASTTFNKKAKIYSYVLVLYIQYTVLLCKSILLLVEDFLWIFYDYKFQHYFNAAVHPNYLNRPTVTQSTVPYRRRINTEEMAKVVAAIWGTEFIKILAALAIFYWRKWWIHPILHIVLVQIIQFFISSWSNSSYSSNRTGAK